MNVQLESETSQSRNLPTVTNVEMFSSLNRSDLPSGVKNVHGLGEKKTWLPKFSQQHLPQSRLQNNDDDMSGKFVSVDTSRKRRKVKVKPQRLKVSRNVHSRLYSPHVSGTSEHKYSTYIPLRDLWLNYITDLMQLNKQKINPSVLPSLAQKMMKADLHGCSLTVRRSKCPSYVGVEGIVIQETRNMFTVISPDDKVRRLPKANSVFTTVVNSAVFTIHGNQFLVRPGERASRKFKSKSTIDL